MAKVYTKTGDRGETSLVDGTRISKSSALIDAYGEVDELNSTIGLVQSFNKSGVEVDTLEFIQNKLFDLGSLLACPIESRAKYLLPVFIAKDIQRLESSIDYMQEQLIKLTSFILPGGSYCAAHCHISRTVCRKVERSLVKLSEEYSESIIPGNSLMFINRLSDYFFVLSRFFNMKEGVTETVWTKS